MALTQDDILNILKMVDQAPVGRLSIQTGDLKLEVVKGAPGSFISTAAATPSTIVQQVAPVLASLPIPAAPPASIPAGTGLTIKAPILGIFYRRPEPGAPAYVEEGSLVEEDTTIALIEVMKLFNPVKAGVRGRIRRICVENGALVEYQQDLFEIDPT
jgi:acetyl-CoA carboxylase biotin carboxyl carrier protein